MTYCEECYVMFILRIGGGCYVCKYRRGETSECQPWLRAHVDEITEKVQLDHRKTQ